MTYKIEELQIPGYDPGKPIGFPKPDYNPGAKYNPEPKKGSNPGTTLGEILNGYRPVGEKNKYTTQFTAENILKQKKHSDWKDLLKDPFGEKSIDNKVELYTLLPVEEPKKKGVGSRIRNKLIEFLKKYLK